MSLLIILLLSSAFSSNFSVDTTYSYIKYTGNHPLHSWTGISRNIDFELDCNIDDCIMSVSTPLERFNSGNDSRDSNMLYYTEALSYPLVSFQSNSFKFNEKFDKSISVSGILNFHGINKRIPLKIVLNNQNDELWATCDFNFNLDLFDIERPSLLMIKVDKSIRIETKFKLIKK